MARWTEADLDRCEHGRHSIDPCFSCPGGWSLGNLFLSELTRVIVKRVENGETQIRIGTMVHGEPIWVSPRRALRGHDDGPT